MTTRTCFQLGVRVALLVLFAGAAIGTLSAQEPGPNIEPGLERIQFNPPREATMRASSNVVRGFLVFVTRDFVGFVTNPGTPREKRVDIPLKTVTSLRTNDGQFQYKPKDDFTRLVQYADQLPGISIEDARQPISNHEEQMQRAYGLNGGSSESSSAPPVNRPPAGGFASGSQTPEANSGDAGGFANSGGFGGVGTQPPPGNGAPVPAFTTPGTSNEAGAIPVVKKVAPAAGFDPYANVSPQAIPASPAPSTPQPIAQNGEIISCSKCGKDVPYQSSYGSRCPHCGVLWELSVPVPNLAGAAPFQPQPGQGQSAPVAAGAAVGHVAVPGGPTQLPPPPPPAVTGNGTSAEFDLATLPTWMKAAVFFAGFFAVYYVAFVRR